MGNSFIMLAASGILLTVVGLMIKTHAVPVRCQ